jgi:hypothetical protein
MQIKPAQKFQQYARVCFWGTEKAGKSHQALQLATLLAGEAGKIGVISSEYASSQLLQHRFPHDIIDLAEVDENGHIAKDAFSASRYQEAIKLFTKAGYQVIVIDSLSHLWEGEGGILDAVNKPGQNTFNDGWGQNTPIYREVIQTILSARCHVLITLRAKDEYKQEAYTKPNGEPGTRPKNVGQCPVMRKGFGYEMHLKIRMDSMIGYVEATAMQDYIPRGEEIEAIDDDFAVRLLGALDGVPLPEPSEQQKAMRTLLDEFYSLAPLTYAKIPNWEQMALRAALGISKGTSLPTDYSEEHIKLMQAYVEAKKKPAQRKTQGEVSLVESSQPAVNNTATPTPHQNEPKKSPAPELPLGEQVKQAKLRASSLGLAKDAAEWASLLKTCKVASIKSAVDLAKVTEHMDAFERDQAASDQSTQPQATPQTSTQAEAGKLDTSIRDKLNDLYVRAKKLKLCTSDKQFVSYVRRVVGNPQLDIKYMTLTTLEKVEDDIITKEMAQEIDQAGNQPISVSA